MKLNRFARCMREFARDLTIGVAVFVAVIVLAILDSRAARPAPALGSTSQPSSISSSVDSAAALSLAHVKSGTLVLRNPTSEVGDTATAAFSAERLDTNVDVTVSGPVARATVTQRFRNSGNAWVDGIYAFPLPNASTVDTLSMHIGKRLIKGEIASRARARQIYQAAMGAGLKTNSPINPGANVFMASVANIGPGEEISVKIEYQELLRGDGDAYSLRIPLVVAPRHAPRSNLHPVKLDEHAGVSGPNQLPQNQADKTNNAISLQVRINAGFPLGSVTSDTHEIALRRTGEATAILGLHQGRLSTDRDFELSWKTKRKSAPLSTAFHEKLGEQDYVLAMLAPPRAKAAPPPISREIIFVIDTSASMSGTAIEQARESLTHALKRLRPGDRFNIIGFNSAPELLFREPVALTGESLSIATNFVSRLEAQGKFEILPAIEAALADPRKKDTRRIRQVVLLTDGEISNDSKFLSVLAQKRGRSRVFIVGIGSTPSQFLMRRAAEIGRGSFVRIATQSDVLPRMNRLFEQLERPVITNLKIEWASGLRVDAWPNPLPDLYIGEPLVITARVSALKGDMKISGELAGRPWSQKISLAKSKLGSGIGKFWARRKIASLEARKYTGQSARDVNTAIEAIALDHGIVSRMTTLIEMDATPSRIENQSLASEGLPFDLPAGWIHDGSLVGHTPNSAVVALAKRELAAAPGQLQPATSPPSVKKKSDGNAVGPASMQVVAKIQPNAAGRGNVTTKDASDAIGSRTWILTTMAVIFSLMSALTLGLWRHLRRSVDPARRRRGENQAF